MRELDRFAVFGGEERYPGQHKEMRAHIDLAVRHLEDARMRLGKVKQYAEDGVSVLDKIPAKEFVAYERNEAGGCCDQAKCDAPLQGPAK